MFDLDGTLIDSLTDIAEAANEVLGSFGFPGHEVDEYRFLVGDGAHVLMERIVPKGALTPDLGARILTAWKAIYADRWDRTTRPYAGMEDVVEALHARGLRQGVLSNKPEVFTKACVERFFPKGQLDPVWGLVEGRAKKPDPQGALEMAKEWGLEPEDILYVGDTNTDMQTAVAAGMFALGVTWGFRPKEELLEHGAQGMVEQVEEILDWAIPPAP